MDLLDITHAIDVLDMSDPGAVREHTVVAQPGLRWAQANALVESLLRDRVFSTISLAERNRVLVRLRNEVMGRMLEDIVLLETKLAHPKCHVFKLQFAVGEYDMVIADPHAATCEIYEVKHSDKRDVRQSRHLVDEQKCRATEFRFGPISRRTVLYRGENCQDAMVSWQNVEEYLMALPSVF